MEIPLPPRLYRRDRLRADSRDVDGFQHMRLSALCTFMQESAWHHAESLGFGYSHLLRDGRFWVLSRLTLQVRRLPRWGEEFDLVTWPAGHRGALALRDFRFFCDDEVLVDATTAWLVVDRHSRRPLRPRDVLPLPAEAARYRALDEIPARLPPLPGDGVTRRVTAEWSDVDLNGHVNNTRYVDWMLDGLGPGFHRRHRPRRLEMNFLAELHQGETLELEGLEGEGPSWMVEGRRPGGIPVVRGRVDWAPVSA